jgi:hypothetical protein
MYQSVAVSISTTQRVSVHHSRITQRVSVYHSIFRYNTTRNSISEYLYAINEKVVRMSIHVSSLVDARRFVARIQLHAVISASM